MTGNISFWQKITNPILGEEVTCSAIYRPHTSASDEYFRPVSFTASLPSSLPSSETEYGSANHEDAGSGSPCRIRLVGKPDGMYFYFTVSSVTEIIAAKVEYGNKSTLNSEVYIQAEQVLSTITFPLPVYVDEYARCNQYTIDNFGDPTPNTYPCNPNLLINSYFIGGGSQQGAGYFPINQRGQTSYTGAEYGIDGWKTVGNATVTLNTTGISFTAISPSNLRQIVGNSNLDGLTLTASGLYKSITSGYLYSIIIRDSQGTEIARTSNVDSAGIAKITFQVPSGSGNISFEFNSQIEGTFEILGAKLELGPVQTLAHQDYLGNWVLNEIPNFAEEYSKCTKYDLVTNNFSGLCVQGAGGHNSVYRGLNLGSSVTDEQWSVIQDGTFDNLYIGDYWVINGTTYRIAAFDYYWQTGNISSATKHHVTIVPDGYLANQYMNPTNTTEGGYVGSYMYTDVMPTCLSKVQTDFGASHILTRREVLSNSVDATKGTVNGYAWYDYQIGLMTEQNVYGNKAFGDTPMVDNVVSKIYTIDRAQYPLFRFDESIISNRTNGWTWLRNVVNSSSFAYADGFGACSYGSASVVRGVRPAFSIFAG